MSVAVNSFSRPKRLFDENEPDSLDRGQATHKRSRLHCSPSGARCVHYAAETTPPYACSPSSLTALLGLFPDMDEKVK